MTTMDTWKHDDLAPELRLPPGPWDDEPDKATWIDEATDLDCMIHRNRLGALCGYVGVPPGHPSHEVDYGFINVDVHGGLTYSAFCQENEDDPSEGLCHVPKPGRPADVWWLGFDCGHSFDYVPGMEAFGVELVGIPQTYRDFAYVKAEVEQLAQQLAASA